MSDPNHADPRERLLTAAAQIFADKGYALASTREICKLAEVNVAAIHYYFGDKASLYREIFRIPGEMIRLPDAFGDPNSSLFDAMLGWYSHLMSFAVFPDQATRMRLLILREQMQPSGVLEPGAADILRPWHDALANFLAPRLGVHEADVELHHLVFSLAGIAMVLFVERRAVATLAPGLMDTPEQLEATVERLAWHGVALVESEMRRRAVHAPTAHSTSPAHAERFAEVSAS